MEKLVHDTSKCLNTKHISFYVVTGCMLLLFFVGILANMPVQKPEVLNSPWWNWAFAISFIMTVVLMITSWSLMSPFFSINNGRGLFWIHFGVVLIYAVVNWFFGIAFEHSYFTTHLRWGLLVMALYATIGETMARDEWDSHFFIRLIVFVAAFLILLMKPLWADITASLIFGIIVISVMAQAPFRLTKKDLDQRLEVVKYQVSSD